jgi:hypothetical protein
MRKGINGRLAIGLAAAASLWTATTLHARPSTPPETLDCTVTVDSTPLPVHSEPFVVQANYTEVIGDSVSASFQEESKITVLGARRMQGDAGKSLHLMLNTAQAAAGEWTLTLKGEKGECSGKIKVAAGTADKN